MIFQACRTVVVQFACHLSQRAIETFYGSPEAILDAGISLKGEIETQRELGHSGDAKTLGQSDHNSVSAQVHIWLRDVEERRGFWSVRQGPGRAGKHHIRVK